MPKVDAITVADQLAAIPRAVRPVVGAARRMVKSIGPSAAESAYQSQAPRSGRAMWKIIRYSLRGAPVAAIGVFPTYAVVFFPRGREIDNGSKTLEGTGKEFRFVRLHAPADASRREVRRIVRDAFALARRGVAETTT